MSSPRQPQTSIPLSKNGPGIRWRVASAALAIAITLLPAIVVTRLAQAQVCSVQTECGVPPNYCQRCDTAIATPPNTPPFSGLTSTNNWKFDALNPSLNMYLGRITDNNTQPGTLFSVDPSSTARQWNAASQDTKNNCAPDLSKAPFVSLLGWEARFQTRTVRAVSPYFSLLLPLLLSRQR
jgi:hypothetical protein